jgi:hypothetical protein
VTFAVRTCVRPPASVQEVPTVSAVQGIVAIRTFEEVGAKSPIQDVVATSTSDLVVASESENGVRTGSAGAIAVPILDVIFLPVPRELVIEVRANDVLEVA